MFAFKFVSFKIMIDIMKRLAVVFTISVFISNFFLINPSIVFAAGTLYLSPASKTVSQGTSFSLQIRENSDSDNVNAVQANLSYDANKLDFVGFDLVGTAFDVQLVKSGGGGSVSTSQINTAGGKTGDQLVVTVTFKAKVAGSTSISFASGSALVRTNDTQNILSGTSGATITITSIPSQTPPPVTQPPSSTGGTSSSTGVTSPTTSTTTPAKDTAAPSITDIKVVDVGFKTAALTWKTNESATSVVEYGLSEGLGIIAYDTNMTTNHKIALASSFLVPGTRFYYRVSSKDAAGNAGKSKLTSFKTKGYGVKIHVLDLAGEPIKGAQVTLIPGFDETKADINGFAIFVDIAPGKHSVQILVGDQTLASTIDIQENNKPEIVQNFEVRVAASHTVTQGENALRYGSLVVIAALALAAAVLVWFSKNQLLAIKTISGNQGEGGKPGNDQGSSPIISSGPKQTPRAAPQPKVLPPKNEPKLEVFRDKE